MENTIARKTWDESSGIRESLRAPAARPVRPITQELVLLTCAGIFLTANQLGLIIAQDRSWFELWPLAIWLLCAGIGWGVLQQYLPRRDPFLFPTILFLTGWGMILVVRLLPNYALRQATWLVFGLLILLIPSIIPRVLLRVQRYHYQWLALGLTLTAATLVFGVNPSGFGPRLWLGFGELYFQPSEPLKLLLILFLASHLAEHRLHFRWRAWMPLVAMEAACLGLLLWQRDFGTATIFFVVFFLMLYIATGKAALLALGGGSLLAAAVLAYQFVPLAAYRINIWLDPWGDADNTSFQIAQSLMAIADGGLIGSGMGQGIPTFIPVVHTDFTYAAIVEEWGLLGGVAVLTALLVIVLRGLRTAARLQERPFLALLATGVSLLFAIQTLVIVGGAMNMIPLTGVTLPLVSYGGSSLLTFFFGAGLLLALSGVAEHEA